MPVFDCYMALVLRTARNGQNAMNVVWHHDKGIELNVLKMIRNLAPAVNSNAAEYVEYDSSVGNLSKSTAHLKRADGDEVVSDMRVVGVP